MAWVWILATLAASGLLGWPVTAGVLRFAREADARQAAIREAAVQDLAEQDPAADQDLADPIVPEPGAPSVDAGTVADDGTQILRGGLVIGILERLAVAVAILGGQPVAIAYIVAVKGLGRYAELKKTPAASERFIIGTLASMLWAAGVAAIAKWLVLP